jgi:hypothetical protein
MKIVFTLIFSIYIINVSAQYTLAGKVDSGNYYYDVIPDTIIASYFGGGGGVILLH